MDVVQGYRPRLAIAVVVIATAGGCQLLKSPGQVTSESLLEAAQPSPTSITLDIYWARTAIDDTEFAEALWQSVEEDRLPVETRRALADQGLRAGVIGGSPTSELSQLLNPAGEPVAPASNRIPLVAKPPKVTRRLKQIDLGQRLELQSTDKPRSFTLLASEQHQLVGRQYPDAQGIYGFQALSRTADRVEIELLPEMHHGQPRMQYRPSGPGMVVQQLAREIEGFDDLRVVAELSPGEMLVVTCLHDAEHRLGGLFHHSELESFTEQKYLLVRLAHVPKSKPMSSSERGFWPWSH